MGTRPRAHPARATDTIELPDNYALVLAGGQSVGTHRRILTAFAAQLAVALSARRLQEEPAAAAEQARINELRASLLSAVSHDLRTPLSSIKASASSLLSEDVSWSREAIGEFARAIVGEADRLNALVGNLLDLSRLQAGASPAAGVAAGRPGGGRPQRPARPGCRRFRHRHPGAARAVGGPG